MLKLKGQVEGVTDLGFTKDGVKITLRLDPGTTYTADRVITLPAGDADSTVGAGGGGAANIDDLLDVTITAPAAQEFLRFDGSNWINESVAGIATPDLQQVYDSSGSPSERIVIKIDGGFGVGLDPNPVNPIMIVNEGLHGTYGGNLYLQIPDGSAASIPFVVENAGNGYPAGFLNPAAVFACKSNALTPIIALVASTIDPDGGTDGSFSGMSGWGKPSVGLGVYVEVPGFPGDHYNMYFSDIPPIVTDTQYMQPIEIPGSGGQFKLSWTQLPIDKAVSIRAASGILPGFYQPFLGPDFNGLGKDILLRMQYLDGGDVDPADATVQWMSGFGTLNFEVFNTTAAVIVITMATINYTQTINFP